jgi:hypothetical protein
MMSTPEIKAPSKAIGSAVGQPRILADVSWLQQPEPKQSLAHGGHQSPDFIY